jgi:anti-anti-sigma factor
MVRNWRPQSSCYQHWRCGGDSRRAGAQAECQSGLAEWVVAVIAYRMYRIARRPGACHKSGYHYHSALPTHRTRRTGIRERIKRLLVEGHRIVVNLSELEHIDSIGLATIVALHRLGTSRIKLVCSSFHLTALLRRTRLDTVIRFYETEEEAVVFVSGQGVPTSGSTRVAA